jgi:hypothetical protein
VGGFDARITLQKTLNRDNYNAVESRIRLSTLSGFRDAFSIAEPQLLIVV